ncbi:MAG: hypothetical protein Q8941_05320 [Bacteroidota bacterium]|nr:hypothetical protein [Bacteroidota bacterium]
MIRKLSRFENLWVLIPVIVLWACDLYVISCGIPVSILDDDGYWLVQFQLTGFLLILLIVPFYFYYRLRKNDVNNRRITNLYFPFGLFLVTLLVIAVQLTIASSFFGIYILTRGMPVLSYLAGPLHDVSSWLLLAYVLLQIAFSTDAVHMIRRNRAAKPEMVEKLGDQ